MAWKSARTRLLRSAAVTLSAALALTACSSGDPDPDAATELTGDPVTLEFWGWVPGLEETVAAWNTDNPNIQIEFFRMTGDDGDKIPAAIDAGTAPDIVQMSSHSLPGHIVNNRLTDISENVAGLEDEFTESSWGTVTFADSVYGIPQDSGPTGLMYRTDVFEEHGLEIPTTWDEYIDVARELKAADPDMYIAQFSPNEAGLWMETIWQNGGSFFQIEDDSWVVTVNSPESVAVAELWQTLIDEDLVKVVEMWTPEYWAEINAGTIATINYAAWFPVLLEESAAGTSGLWAVAPTPTFGDQESAGESGGSVNVVPTGTEHVAEAVEFIKWLNASEEGVEYLIDGGVFPSATVGLTNDKLLVEREFFGGQVVNEVFAEAAGRVPGTWTAGPTHDVTLNTLKDEFGRVGNGEISFVEALDNVQAKTLEEMTAMGLEVR